VLFVDDLRHQVVLIDRVGKPIWSYGTPLLPGQAYFQLRAPRFAACLPDQHILIADTGNHRLLEVDTQGQIVWRYGEAPDQTLHEPVSAQRLTNGHTLIVDDRFRRLSEVDPQGRMVWSFRVPFSSDAS
jgi:hypothetical protein